MRIDVLTLFPEIFEPIMSSSMMWKAREQGQLDFHSHNIRDYSQNKWRQVDDTPYGGGGGMILKADVLIPAIESVKGDDDCPVILLSPQGRVFNHQISVELAQHPRLILVCGHYEGFDERIRELAITDEISIGDYVLTGGELASMVIIDSVVRQIEGVLGAEGAQHQDSHADGLLEGPHYTRPQDYRGALVPDVLQSGNHQAIKRWRRQMSLRRSWLKRPELLLTAELDEEDAYFLAELANESALALASDKS
ncbi:tRNA (guanosine(37)-N1)-methyltransferase TrmD [Anaerolineales bacterium]